MMVLLYYKDDYKMAESKNLAQQLQGWNPAELEWKFALYSTSKSRDGQTLEIHSCGMQGIASFVESVRIHLLEKVLTERTPAAHSPFLGKESIGTLEKKDELICDALDEVLMNTLGAVSYAPEDFVSGVLPAPKGYLFYGCKTDEDGRPEQQALFMKRSNPFLSAGKGRLCTTAGDEVTDCVQPVLKFAQALDFLFINDVCYFLNPAIEKDFGMENRHFLICMKRLTTIAQAEIVSNYELLEQAAIKNARKFLEFDSGILEHITRLPITEREDFLLTYGITIDGQGKMETGDPEQCELVIDLLCCRSCLDPLGRLATGHNITPR